MAYTDFTLSSAETQLGLRVEPTDLLPDLRPVATPGWLVDSLARARRMSLVSKKSRSEFLVAPVLMAVRESSGETVSVLSGPPSAGRWGSDRRRPGVRDTVSGSAGQKT